MRTKCDFLFQAATPCSSYIVNCRALGKGTKLIMKMDMKDADMTLWTEAEFEEKCTYIVNDQPADPSTEDCTITQAESSLPRNMIFKYAEDSKQVRRWIVTSW